MGLIWLEFTEPEFCCAHCQGLLIPGEEKRVENGDYAVVDVLLRFCSLQCRAADEQEAIRRSQGGDDS